MTSTIIAPLHVADLTTEQAYRFGQLCAYYAEAGQRAPIDVDGYLLFEDVTAYVLGMGTEYSDRLARWAPRIEAMTLTEEQAQGFACVVCGRNWLAAPDPSAPSVPIGFGPVGQVFVCVTCDD